MMSSHTHALNLNDLHPPLLSPAGTLAGDDHDPPLERLSIDQMLTKYCGEIGLGQLKHFLLTCIPWALQACHSSVMVFADRELAWTCKPESECVWDMDKSVCELEPGSWQWNDGEGWSTVAEWGLICGEKYKVGLVQSLFFAGCMIGVGVFGHMSDSKLGRKGSLMIACILSFVFGITTSISPNYWAYVLFRVLTGFSTGGLGNCAFVLATEIFGPTKRGTAGMSCLYFSSIGIAIITGIAYIFQTWRSLYIASSIPTFLFLVFILPFISESPRWYLVQGKPDQAMKIMHSIAKSNNKHLPKNVCIALDEATKSSDETIETVKGSVINVIKSPLTRSRLFLVMGIDFTFSIAYYGLNLNVMNLNTNLYLSVLLNAVVEVPSFLLSTIFINKFGRKRLGTGMMWFSGIFCIIGGILGSEGIWKVVTMACGVLGVFGMAGISNLMFIYVTELFPTVVRNTALGCAMQMIQFGAIIAPFVVVMGSRFAFVVFGACGIIGGILMFFLPETLNKPLYDTMNGITGGQKAKTAVDIP